MRRIPSRNVFPVLVGVLALLLAGGSAAQTGKKVLTFEDIMKFREIRTARISEDGAWVAYAVEPGRGDGEAVIHHVKTGRYFRIERGQNPVFSKDSRWAAAAVAPGALESAKAKKDKPQKGMALLDTSSGEILHFENIRSFAFSADGRWLAYQKFKEDKPEEKGPAGEPGEEPAGKPEVKPGQKTEGAGEAKPEEKPAKIGSTLVVRNLRTGKETEIPWVDGYAFGDRPHLAYTVAAEKGEMNGLYVLDLTGEPETLSVETVKDGVYGPMTWAENKALLAYTSSSGKTEDWKEAFYSLKIWDAASGKPMDALSAEAVPEGYIIPEKTRLDFSRDGKRLFFGLKPMDLVERTEEKLPPVEEEADLYDRERILADRGVDVWHWNDPFISTHQKIQWSRTKDTAYTGVFFLDTKKAVQLADGDMPTVRTTENPSLALGLSDVPYRKEVTWDGRYSDVYRVDLRTGKRSLFLRHYSGTPSLSPDGRWVVYYLDRHWFLYDTEQGTTRNLTESLDVPFYDEDHDYPEAVPGYRTAGWVAGGKAVLINDKYDVWRFETGDGKALCLTGGEGRKNRRIFRVLRLDPEANSIAEGADILYSSYHDYEKNFGFYAGNSAEKGVRVLLEEKKKFSFRAKAKEADVLIYTREDFKEFPDLWVADLSFKKPKKISLVNPQIAEFAWGEAELVEWLSADGIPLQGVLIKPAGYEPGKRYPVIVYYYRFFSQRMYEFNQMVVNHRPNFPYYTSNGYAVFLPDIRFEVGRPGPAATKCLVPGVQKLIAMGVADPKAIGLHGHSWSGYQTAFVITQTDIFACAVAGAPVTNMTSAYSGIRWQSGLARQFQYEKSQSRIGATLWEAPWRYIENSPVFFADKIRTPTLIMFGDVDGAVPWYQGIEFYLALRRLGKDCVFLQYRNEPHHPQRYANKLDYSIKMHQYFDHYLKGKPAAEWIKKGVPYRGK
jgi:dipeptidyl aminopeptidase/acylaminoacyl peptidase